MGLVETEALVLKSYALAEADKIVVYLTRGQGLVRAVAKGAKRLTSRFGGSLEPFSRVRIEYYQKGDAELVTLRRSEIIDSRFARASDPEFLAGLSYFPELLTEFALPADPDERIYRMTRACLEALDPETRPIAAVTAYFEYWLLRLGGFLPSWDACSHCGRTLSDDEPAAIRADYRLSCGSCERLRDRSTAAADVRRLFSSAGKLPPGAFAEKGAEAGEALDALSAVLRKMIATVLDREGRGRPANSAR
jgi:DNA repair protein RecO (recombination protein O)